MNFKSQIFLQIGCKIKHNFQTNKTYSSFFYKNFGMIEKSFFRLTLSRTFHTFVCYSLNSE